jgi:polysaccharide deacetylase family protein (PEP-CTERM system associated)
MKNALTIDLEEHYQATAFSSTRERSSSHSLVSRVERNTHKLLELLAESRRLATFFVVGSVAEQFPQLIQTVARAGHEIACHSFAHRQIFTLSRDQFYEDTRRAKLAIENAAGAPVQGYRAPSFSITRESEWAFEALAELGFTYDSSIFPIRHLHFDMRHVSRAPFLIVTSAGPLVEFPMTTLQLAGARAPLAGGAYFRLLPYRYMRWAIRYLNASDALPACVYLHPWELDPEQPRMNGGITARMRHYFGLKRTEAKFRRLLQDFDFAPMGSLVKELNERAPTCAAAALPQIRLSPLPGCTNVS